MGISRRRKIQVLPRERSSSDPIWPTHLAGAGLSSAGVSSAVLAVQRDANELAGRRRYKLLSRTPDYDSNDLRVLAISWRRRSTRAKTVSGSNDPLESRRPALTPVRISIPS